MRVISGTARGTKLQTLAGENTRPTLDRVKEALFSIIQNHIYDKDVLDLFSGSGALAIESVSRGAKYAICVDNSKDAIKIIDANVKKTHLEKNIEIINTDYKKALNDLSYKKFDLIFLDPPYKTDYGLNAIKMIMEEELLKADGIIIFETDRDMNYIESTYEFARVIDIRKYGRVKLIFLGRKE